jgi:hypothetical protein
MADMEERVSTDATCDVKAWHSNFDNKSCEWKSQYTIADFVEQCEQKGRYLDTLSWGEPNKGKCGADATGRRLGTRVKRVRRDPNMPTPETAQEIEALSAEWGHKFLSMGKMMKNREDRRKIKRSAMLAISKSDLALAKERRGARSIKLKNLKMVRQVFYDKDSKKVGARFFRCVCSKCMERKFSECVAKAWTLGEPVWQ